MALSLPTDLLIRHVSQPGSGMRPPRAVVVTSGGSVEIIAPWYPDRGEDPEISPEDREKFRIWDLEAMSAGTTHLAVSVQRVRNLLKAFLDADFYNLRVPEDDDMHCDVGWQELLLRCDGRERTIGYRGMEEWEPFRGLCARVDRLAGLKVWD